MSEQEPREKGAGGLIVLDATMLLLWLVMGLICFFGLAFIVPKYAEVFIQLDVPLSVATRVFMSLGALFSSCWFVILPLALLLSAVPIAVRPGRSWPAYLICAMLAMIVTVGGVLSVHLPMIRIQQMLSKRK